MAQPDSSLITTLEYLDGNLRMTDHERSSFEYFVCEMATPLSRISHVPTWIPYALQVSREQPAVLYALIAVGSGATAQTRIAHHSLARLRSPAGDNVALNQYCKATSSLQKYIDLAVSEGASVGPVLLCCLLFVVFESMRGESYWALSHLRHGRKAMESVSSLSADERASVLPMVSWSPELTSELLSTLDNFEQESTILDVSSSPIADRATADVPSIPVNLPARFESVEEAKRALDKIFMAVSKWREDMLSLAYNVIDQKKTEPLTPAMRYCLAHALSREINIGSNNPLERRRLDLLHTCSTWRSIVATLESKQHPRNLAFMNIQQFVSYFTLTTSRNTTEGEMDNFESQFAEVLDRIHQFLNDAAAPAPIAKSPLDFEVRLSFSLEYGILPALYLISLKCRIPHIRQRALALLRNANRREGSYWSGELSTYAESIVHLEEEEAREMSLSITRGTEGQSMSRIPEAARFCDIVIEGVSLHSIQVVCCRYESQESIEILELSGTGAPPLRLQALRRIHFPMLAVC